MLVRALIVVLLALNLGVAAWWLSRPPPPPYQVPASTAGGAPLELVGARPVATAPAAPVAAEGPVQCLRAGPFADRDAAVAAQAALEGLLRAGTLEEVPGAAAGYRVLLPPAADRDAAQATAARLAAAGFQDLLVLGPGAEANAIALGAYRSRQGAEQRLQALRAAGFAVQLRPQGRTEPSQWWLELQTTRAEAVRARLPGVGTGECQLPWPAAGAAGALR